MGLVKSVGGLVAGMWNSVKSFFANGATNASNLVVNMGRMIIKGWSFVKNNVGRLAGALWDLVKKKIW
ncbi:hypothetical protein BsIDN1_11050 [Bacillus safensis]|uniref:Uncharacterized protein n=1 Tax=Bacillus safensis TaxID=561879 RepID=A0A5S9M1L4_BACIA|nr:hypothetical protein BsIDN1_11050 [Bacillus safensis]